MLIYPKNLILKMRENYCFYITKRQKILCFTSKMSGKIYGFVQKSVQNLVSLPKMRGKYCFCISKDKNLVFHPRNEGKI